MISLFDYLESLKNYEKNINNELKEILTKAKINFTYEDIYIKSIEMYDDKNGLMELIIKKYNGNRDKIMRINLENGKFETITFQAEQFFTSLTFENAKIDNNSLIEIFNLANNNIDFYNNELSYEKIMRKIRDLPDKLPFYDRPYREKERRILEETMVSKDKLPSFLYEEKNKAK